MSRKIFKFEVTIDSSWFGDEYGEELENSSVDFATKLVTDGIIMSLKNVYNLDDDHTRFLVLKKVEAIND